jgi:hypothetical protein
MTTPGTKKCCEKRSRKQHLLSPGARQTRNGSLRAVLGTMRSKMG